MAVPAVTVMLGLGETEQQRGMCPAMIDAIIFDMDGLLLDSEVYWARTRREYCAEQGCAWTDTDEDSVKGHNSPEWAAVIQRRCGLDLPLPVIIEGVTDRMRALYDERLPLLPGAQEVPHALHGHYPLAVASSSPPEIIEFVLTEAGIRNCFTVVVSADTVGRGKPAPDVFLVAARELGYPPESIAVFEDSSAGITAGAAAGMKVIAVPNPHNPPAGEALQLAALVLSSLDQFRLDMLTSL